MEYEVSPKESVRRPGNGGGGNNVRTKFKAPRCVFGTSLLPPPGVELDAYIGHRHENRHVSLTRNIPTKFSPARAKSAANIHPSGYSRAQQPGGSLPSPNAEGAVERGVWLETAPSRGFRLPFRICARRYRKRAIPALAGSRHYRRSRIAESELPMLCGSFIREARDLFAPGCKPMEIEPGLWRCNCCGGVVELVKPGVWRVFQSTTVDSEDAPN